MDESRRSLEREAVAGGRREREAFTRAVLASGCGRVLAWVPEDPARALPRIGEVRAKAMVGSGVPGVVLAVAVVDIDDMIQVASRIGQRAILVIVEEEVGYAAFGGTPWRVAVHAACDGDEALGFSGVIPAQLGEELGGASIFSSLSDYAQIGGLTQAVWTGDPPTSGETTGVIVTSVAVERSEP